MPVSQPQRPASTRIGLSSEHYFDDVVFSRLLQDQALPYPGGRAVLLEFFEIEFRPAVSFRLADLRRRGLLPIVAHPERYPAFGKRPELLERLLDVGAAGLLDIGALVGRYGRQVKRVAETLLEAGHYHAACSDAHRASDIAAIGAAILAPFVRWRRACRKLMNLKSSPRLRYDRSQH